jgi:hypothetical protein
MVVVLVAAVVVFENASAQGAAHAETDQHEKQSRFQPLHVPPSKNCASRGTNSATARLIRADGQNEVSGYRCRQRLVQPRFSA